MPMSRADKDQAIAGYGKRFAEDSIFVITRYPGLTVAEMTELRNKVRESGARFNVVKNRLAKRALQGTEVEGLSSMLTGPVGLASSTDPSVAKVIYEFTKTNKKLVIVGGAMGSHILDQAGVEQLAKLPSLDELRGKIIGLIQAPAQKIAGVVAAPAGQLARVVGAYAKKG